MDLVSASLCLYLLFPILTDRQQRYSELIKRNVTSSPAEVEKRLELIRFLGLENSDSAIFSEDYYVPTQEDDSTAESEVEPDVEEFAEIYYRNENGHLKIYEYGEEKFFVGDKEGSRNSIVSVNGDTSTRTKFDSEYRMVEQIVWKNSSVSTEAKMLDRKNWYYKDATVYMTDENFEENKFSDTIYNEKKLPVKVSVYIVDAEEIKEGDGETPKRKLSEIIYFEYDESDRIIIDKRDSYERKKNNSTGRTKDVIVYRQEKNYHYTENSKNPDLKFYEDGKLRLEVQYLNDDDYYESVFFPGGTGVRSKYEDGTKVSEKMFLYKE